MLALGYPQHSLAVEKNLRELLGPEVSRVPHRRVDRRVDIVCFSKGSMKPLLIIECKAVDFTPSMFHQLLGYNQFIKASYVALAGAKQIILGWYDTIKKEYRFKEGLPSYGQLTSD